MDETEKQQRWPVLQKDDESLLDELFHHLTTHAEGNAYSEDGKFAAKIAQLPPGLRAMAATHCLDISLCIDSITWHFGNFGEPHLVAETEAGLRELGLHGLAQCFVEAKELMQPLLARRTEADGDPHEILERAGLDFTAEEIDLRALALKDVSNGESAAMSAARKSAICDAWIRYARQYPERVFIT